ncbi:hypothetical protein RDWZM_005358, partial [Blomia tropicalis]
MVENQSKTRRSGKSGKAHIDTLMCRMCPMYLYCRPMIFVVRSFLVVGRYPFIFILILFVTA